MSFAAALVIAAVATAATPAPPRAPVAIAQATVEILRPVIVRQGSGPADPGAMPA